MIVIGIDPSINTTGVAVVECKGEDKNIKDLRLIKTKGKDIFRLLELYEKIIRILQDFYTDNMKIVIERPRKYSRKIYGRSLNIGSVVELNNAFSVIYLAVYHYILHKEKIKTPYAPSGYRKGKKGLPTKESARYILKSYFVIKEDIEKIEKANHNEIDALMLAVWGCEQITEV